MCVCVCVCVCVRVRVSTCVFVNVCALLYNPRELGQMDRCTEYKCIHTLHVAYHRHDRCSISAPSMHCI